MKLKATDRFHSTPISRKLPSNFIEFSFGLQDSGLWAEMFFNRSFEPFVPYRLINKLCSYLFERDWDANSQYVEDWRKVEWFHSSYEHNAWFAFPGVAGYQPVRDDSTFIIEDSPLKNVHIGLVPDTNHGTHAMRVVNDSDGDGGLAQDGKYCRKGVAYNFRGAVRKVRGGGELRVALFREGTTDSPVCIRALPDVGSSYAEIRAELCVNDDGRYTFVLLTPPGSEYVCDDFSLMPGDAIHGFRKDAVEAGRYVAPKVVRWPGGCFTSLYDWRDGVGKRRVPSYSWFWGGYQYNDIGTDEMATYVEDIGAESMICINMFHPYKRFFDYVPKEFLGGDPNDPEMKGGCPHGFDLPQFTDIEEGAREAAAWVEYCNGDETTEGGRARIANGRVKPYNVKYWEMDNETFRWFTPEEYAETCIMYSKAMKAVDPTIKIGMATYGYSGQDVLKTIDIACEHIDFLADRGIIESDFEYKLARINELNATRGTHIRYCNSEWVPMNCADVFNMVPPSERYISRRIIFNKWSYALETASNLIRWQRYGDIVDFSCFSTYADTHSQAVIETPKEGVYVNPSGMILHMFANTAAYRTLVIEDYLPRRGDKFQIQLSENEAGDALVLNVLNRSENDEALDLDVSVFGVKDGVYPGTMLFGRSIISMSSPDTPGEDRVQECEAFVTVRDGHVVADNKCLSFAEYVIPKGN